jgi:monoamine oxidase
MSSSPLRIKLGACLSCRQYEILRIFFAGEHTSAEFNGYMEGAAESGDRAAKEVLVKVGRGR